MDSDVIATHLENLDRRLANVEQILPTLATKDQIALLATKEEIARLATKEEMALLATKEELAAAIAPLATRAELAAAIAPLATKAELAAAIAPLATKAELAAAIAPLATQEGLDALRRHMNILHEDLRSDIRLLASTWHPTGRSTREAEEAAENSERHT